MASTCPIGGTQRPANMSSGGRRLPVLRTRARFVWGDRVFVTSAISSRGHATFTTGQRSESGESDDRSSHRWMIYALDRRTGKILWEREAHQGEPIDKRNPKSTYASSTPVTDGRVVVSWFGSHGVYALTAAGDFLWKVDLGRVNL
jgi:outer membrane protein assembly factor BamB